MDFDFEFIKDFAWKTCCLEVSFPRIEKFSLLIGVGYLRIETFSLLIGVGYLRIETFSHLIGVGYLRIEMFSLLIRVVILQIRNFVVDHLQKYWPSPISFDQHQKWVGFVIRVSFDQKGWTDLSFVYFEISFIVQTSYLVVIIIQTFKI